MNPATTSQPGRGGELWSAAEDIKLLRAFFYEKATCGDLAKAHKRTEAAILTRLERHSAVVTVVSLLGTRSYHRVEQSPWHTPTR